MSGSVKLSIGLRIRSMIHDFFIDHYYADNCDGKFISRSSWSVSKWLFTHFIYDCASVEFPNIIPAQLELFRFSLSGQKPSGKHKLVSIFYIYYTSNMGTRNSHQEKKMVDSSGVVNNNIVLGYDHPLIYIQCATLGVLIIQLIVVLYYKHRRGIIKRHVGKNNNNANEWGTANKSSVHNNQKCRKINFQIVYCRNSWADERSIVPTQCFFNLICNVIFSPIVSKHIK